jgi:hypothetical protein
MPVGAYYFPTDNGIAELGRAGCHHHAMIAAPNDRFWHKADQATLRRRCLL